MKLFDPEEAIDYISKHKPDETAAKISGTDNYYYLLDIIADVSESAGLMNLEDMSSDLDDPDVETLAQAAYSRCKNMDLTLDDFILIINAENEYEDSLFDI